MITKQEFKDKHLSRREAALFVLNEQHRRCKKQKPRGHIWDGFTCLWCGAKQLGLHNRAVDDLERMVREAPQLPINQGGDKASLKAA